MSKVYKQKQYCEEPPPPPLFRVPMQKTTRLMDMGISQSIKV